MVVPFRELELRHHALGTPCAWPALNLLCNLTNGRARRHRWVTSETRKHKSTCGKAGDSLLSFRTALSVCLVYSVCLLHFSRNTKPAYDKTLHWLHLHCTMSRVALRARASHACLSRVCLPASVSSLLETHTSSAWLAWERSTQRLHSMRELIAPIVSACRCVRSAPENPGCGRDFSRVSPAVRVPLLPRQSGVCTRGAHSFDLEQEMGDRRVPVSIHCLQIERPLRESSQWEKNSFPPAERARRSTTLPSEERRQWASMSRPNLCSMRSCWRWWLALSINFILIGQPSSRPSRVEASSTSVSCALGRHLRIGACPFFPICILRFVDRGEGPYSSRPFIPASNYYGNVVGLDECGYRAMPKVEQTLASYLSPHVASSLKAPALPTKPLRTTSTLVGRGYSAAGQAGACLHTMSVLQAYQADLLKELDEREQVSSDDIAELRGPLICLSPRH